jgi:hypothetical protein
MSTDTRSDKVLLDAALNGDEGALAFRVDPADVVLDAYWRCAANWRNWI